MSAGVVESSCVVRGESKSWIKTEASGIVDILLRALADALLGALARGGSNPESARIAGDEETESASSLAFSPALQPFRTPRCRVSPERPHSDMHS